jgi:CDP-paratose 2-epimerase
VKLLITGVCGFVGSTLARGWLETAASDGDELVIHGIDNFSRAGSEANRIELARRGVRLSHGDLRCPEDLSTLPAVDWVIDSAANASVLAGIDGLASSRQIFDSNLFSTINLLEYCKRHRAGFILLSTSRVYSIESLCRLPLIARNEAWTLDTDQPLPVGASGLGISEAFSTTPPISLYGASKLASELLALEYGSVFDFPVWINRCGVLAGAGQFGRPDQGIFAYWLNAYLREKPLRYIGFNGTGWQARDMLHPLDLIPLLRRQCQFSGTPLARILNLGGGPSRTISLRQVTAWCEQRWGTRQVAQDLRPRPFDIPWFAMDYSLAEGQFDWRPAHTCEQILDEIAAHAEQHPDWLELSGAN